MTSTIANAALERWNAMDAAEAAREILPCCGSQVWADEVASGRPFVSIEELLATSDAVWQRLSKKEWLAAFESHPRIGQQHARAATAKSLEWSQREQNKAMSADEAVKVAMAEGNRRYEDKFGWIFIVFASGRSAAEILAMLERRMGNAPEAELQEAAEQQRQITQLRLRRWMGVN